VSETFRRRKDGEDWALDMERNIDCRKARDRRVRQRVQAVPFAAGSLLYSIVKPSLSMLLAALIFRSRSAQKFPSLNEVL
jgi:hypothetical protein